MKIIDIMLGVEKGFGIKLNEKDFVITIKETEKRIPLHEVSRIDVDNFVIDTKDGNIVINCIVTQEAVTASKISRKFGGKHNVINKTYDEIIDILRKSNLTEKQILKILEALHN